MQRFVVFAASLLISPLLISPLLVSPLLGGCYGKAGRASSITGGLTTGAITTAPHNDYTATTIAARMTEPGGIGEHINGVEFRGFVAGTFDEPAIPNVYGFTVRQLGDGVQSSIQMGWMLTAPVGRSTVFAKLMFDMIAGKQLEENGPTTLSAFSPTFDAGIAPWGRGICVSGSATWDVHFNEPDRAIVGAYLGLCGGRLKR